MRMKKSGYFCVFFIGILVSSWSMGKHEPLNFTEQNFLSSQKLNLTIADMGQFYEVKLNADKGFYGALLYREQGQTQFKGLTPITEFYPYGETLTLTNAQQFNNPLEIKGFRFKSWMGNTNLLNQGFLDFLTQQDSRFWHKESIFRIIKNGSQQRNYYLVLTDKNKTSTRALILENVACEFYSGEADYFRKLYESIKPINTTINEEYPFFSFALLRECFQDASHRSQIDKAAIQFFRGDKSQRINRYAQEMNNGDASKIELSKNITKLRYMLSITVSHRTYLNNIARIDSSFLSESLYGSQRVPYIFGAISFLQAYNLSIIQADLPRYVPQYIPENKNLIGISQTEGEKIASLALQYLTDGLDPYDLSLGRMFEANTVFTNQWKVKQDGEWFPPENSRNGANVSDDQLLGKSLTVTVSGSELKTVKRIDIESASPINWPAGALVEENKNIVLFDNDLNTKILATKNLRFEVPRIGNIWYGIDFKPGSKYPDSLQIEVIAEKKIIHDSVKINILLKKDEHYTLTNKGHKLFFTLDWEKIRTYVETQAGQKLTDNYRFILKNTQNFEPSEIWFYQQNPTQISDKQYLDNIQNPTRYKAFNPFTLFTPATGEESFLQLSTDPKSISLQVNYLSYSSPSLLIWSSTGKKINATIEWEGSTPQETINLIKNGGAWVSRNNRLNSLKIGSLDFGSPIMYLRDGIDYPGSYNAKVWESWKFRQWTIEKLFSRYQNEQLKKQWDTVQTENGYKGYLSLERALRSSAFQDAFSNFYSEWGLLKGPLFGKLNPNLALKDLEYSPLQDKLDDFYSKNNISGRPYLFGRLTGTSSLNVDNNSPFQTSKRGGVDGLGMLSNILALYMVSENAVSERPYKLIFDLDSVNFTDAFKKNYGSALDKSFFVDWKEVTNLKDTNITDWYYNGDDTRQKASWKKWDLEGYTTLISDLRELRVGDLLVGEEGLKSDNERTQIGVVVGFLSDPKTWPAGISPQEIWHNVIVVGIKPELDRTSLGVWGSNTGKFEGFTKFPRQYVARRLLKLEEGNFKVDNIAWHPFNGPSIDGYVFYPEKDSRPPSMWPFVPNTGEVVQIGRLRLQIRLPDGTGMDVTRGSLGLVNLDNALDWAYEKESIQGIVRESGDKADPAKSGNIYRNMKHKLTLVAYNSDAPLRETGYPTNLVNDRFSIGRISGIKVATIENDGTGQGEKIIPEPGVHLKIENGILTAKKGLDSYSIWGIAAQNYSDGTGPYPGDDINLLFSVMNKRAVISAEPLSKDQPSEVQELRLAVYDKKMLWRANLYIDKKDLNAGGIPGQDWNDVHPWVTDNEWWLKNPVPNPGSVVGGQNITPYDATWQNNQQKTGSMLYSRGSIDTPFSFNSKMREYALRAFQVQNGLVLTPTEDQLKALMKPSTWLGYLTQVMAKDFKINSEADFWTIKEWINTKRESESISIPAWSSWVWYYNRNDKTFNMITPYIQAKIDGSWSGVGELIKRYDPLKGLTDDVLVWRIFREFPGDLDRKAQYEQDIKTKFIDVIKHYASSNLGKESLVEEDKFAQPDPENNIITSYTLDGTEFRAVWYYGDTGADDTQGIGVDCVGFWHQAAGWDNNPYLLADLKDGYEFGTYDVDKQSQDRYGLLWGTYGPPNAAKWPVSKNSPVTMPNNYQIAAKTNTDAELKERLNLVVPGDVLYYGLGFKYSHTMIVGGVDGVITDVTPDSKDFEKIKIIEATLPQVMSGYAGGNSLFFYSNPRNQQTWAFGRLRNK